MRIAQMVVAPVTRVRLGRGGARVDETGARRRAASDRRACRLTGGSTHDIAVAPQPSGHRGRGGHRAPCAAPAGRGQGARRPAQPAAAPSRDRCCRRSSGQGILKGVRGPRGGYELARERRRITAGDIVRAAMTATGEDGLAGAGVAPRRRRSSRPLGRSAAPRRSWRSSTASRWRICARRRRPKRPCEAMPDRLRFHDLIRELSAIIDTLCGIRLSLPTASGERPWR